MKREYVAPMMEQMQIDEELPLCGSVNGGGSVVDDILFGGIDEGGLLDPAANERLDFENEINKLLW
jgi:hypothetical protein